MCCCGKPNINGEPGAYSWDGKSFSTRHPNPPDLLDGESLVYDLPGRCGRKTDSHSHHFRLVLDGVGRLILVVRHGGGDERLRLGHKSDLDIYQALSDDQRYWLVAAIHHGANDRKREAVEQAHAHWRLAAAEKRIKTRKVRGGSAVKVWIEDQKPAARTDALAPARLTKPHRRMYGNEAAYYVHGVEDAVEDLFGAADEDDEG